MQILRWRVNRAQLIISSIATCRGISVLLIISFPGLVCSVSGRAESHFCRLRESGGDNAG